MLLKFSKLPTLFNLSNFLLFLLFLLALISLNSLHSLTFQFSVFTFALSKHKQPSWLDTNSAVCYFSPFCIIPPPIYLFGYQGIPPRG